MELYLARIVYEPAEPPPDVKAVLQRTQIQVPDPSVGASNPQTLSEIERTVAREGYMIEVLA